MPNRRQFLGTLALPVATAAVGALDPARARRALDVLRELATDDDPPDRVAADADFWSEVARAFPVDRTILNLNNGGVSPSPGSVLDSQKRHLDYSNQAPAWSMWRVLEPGREFVRERLARQWGVDPEEVALTRNASEGLQICQLGIDLRAGDEVLTTNQDYPRMLSTFRQRERREGVVLRTVSIPTPVEDDDELVRRFEAALTERTRLILLCHMINITGQILPVKRVVAMARERGIPAIVDGAHALAHFEFTLPDLDCDYYASSLHKWLFAPHGTGLLYVRRERIESLWPLMAAPAAMDGDIRKFEEIGTHPAAGYLAIGEALSFHQGLGGARKEARLVHLRNQWSERLLERDRVRLHTSLAPGRACGIATFEVEGLDSGRLARWLWDEHRILVASILHEEFEGIRVSPSVYTTGEELDRFTEAVEFAIENGLPA